MKSRLTKYNELQRQIGIRIKLSRESQMLTQAQLAAQAGLSKSFVGLIETGRQTNFSINTLFSIAEALNTTIQNLVVHVNAQEDSLIEKGINIYAPENAEDTGDLILQQTAIINTYYPPNYSDHTISSLLEFLLYLPLIAPMDLKECLCRIDGDIVDNENYICNLMDKLVCAIPESPAKQFADIEYAQIRKKRAQHTISKLVCDLSDPDDVQSLSEKHDAYTEILQLQYHFEKALKKISSLKDSINEKSSKQ